MAVKGSFISLAYFLCSVPRNCAWLVLGLHERQLAKYTSPIDVYKGDVMFYL